MDYEKMMEGLWARVLSQGKASFTKQDKQVLFHHISFAGIITWVIAPTVPLALRKFLDKKAWWYLSAGGEVRDWVRYSHVDLVEADIEIMKTGHPGVDFKAVRR